MIFQKFQKFSPKMQFSQLSFMISSCPQKIILRLCRMEFKSDKLILRIYIYRIFTFQSVFLYQQSDLANLLPIKTASSSHCHLFFTSSRLVTDVSDGFDYFCHQKPLYMSDTIIKSLSPKSSDIKILKLSPTSFVNILGDNDVSEIVILVTLRW